ncbi:ParB/RepB/Spo0J family partition protein, partial [Caballeronia sp. BR00000012568055]|uniref:ParB/RepB/Spo0J family partition protein n=1 Tax=Caballeronia sp. BR00000012568055 TaxID=2918761 RepID=UPI0023F7D91A
MAKKDFSAALSAGVKRDQALRAKDITARFKNVEAALEGRKTLLESQATDSDILNGKEANSYLEALERQGKVQTTFAPWPIDKIDDNPLNSRTIYQEEKIAARAASMAKDGQLVPALAAKHPSDPERAILIDGHYRKQAALQNRSQTLELKIIDGLEPIDFYRLARTANNEREHETVVDLALGYKRLLDGGYATSNDELAGLVGEGKSKVSKVLALLELPGEVQEMISSYPSIFGINVAYELSLYHKATDAKRVHAFATKVLEEELSFQKVKSLREGLAKGRLPRKTFSR